MRMQKYVFFFLLLFLSATLPVQAQIVVITHNSNPIPGLTVEELGRIYLGKQKKFTNGEYIKLSSQAPGSAIRKRFFKEVLDMSEDKVDRYWAKRKYVRNVPFPVKLKGDAAVKAWVASTPNSLGYIDSGSLDHSVKILLILP